MDFLRLYGWLTEIDASEAVLRLTNRQRNKSKCLFWEDNGFVLYYKSLAEEKFRWPRQGDELLSLTGQQINWLPARATVMPSV